MSLNPEESECSNETTALLSKSAGPGEQSKHNMKPSSRHLEENSGADAAIEELLAEDDNDDADNEKKTVESQTLTQTEDSDNLMDVAELPSNTLANQIANKDTVEHSEAASAGKKSNIDEVEHIKEDKNPSEEKTRHSRKKRRPLSYHQKDEVPSLQPLDKPKKNLSASTNSLTLLNEKQGQDKTAPSNKGNQSSVPRNRRNKDPIRSSKETKAMSTPADNLKGKNTYGVEPIPEQDEAPSSPERAATESKIFTESRKDPSSMSVLDKKAAFTQKAEEQLPPMLRRKAEQDRLDKVKYLIIKMITIIRQQCFFFNHCV